MFQLGRLLVQDLGSPLLLTQLPLQNYHFPPCGSFLLFTMILTLGLDTQFGMTEAITSAIMDQWPSTRKHVVIVVFSVCSVCCFLGIPFCMNGGIFIFELISWFSALWSLVVLALLEVFCVAWVYGTEHFIDNLKEMGISLGVSSVYWKVTWKIVSPILMLIILLMSLMSFSPAYYGDYVFWVNMLGGLYPASPFFLCLALVFGKGAGTARWLSKQKIGFHRKKLEHICSTIEICSS